jgi:hypothetical protein
VWHKLPVDLIEMEPGEFADRVGALIDELRSR